MKPLLALTAAALPFIILNAQENKELPPDSTEATGQTFADPKEEGTTRVLVLGAGTHHNFPKYFIGTDSQTLRDAGGLDVAATLNAAEGLTLLEQADVLLFSGNDAQFAQGRFQTALNEFADAGKGIVILHAGAWVHPWDGYNKRFIGGGSTSHGYGEFEVTVKAPEHPVMKDVPATFKITDESYHHRIAEGADIEVLAENNHDDRTHASVFVVNDPKTRIVVITLGHAAEAHDNPAYQTILTNAVKWVAEK